MKDMKNIKSLYILFIFAICVGSLSSCMTTPKEDEPVSVQQLIRDGKIDEAKSFFLSQVDVNAQDETGNTALHEAALINSEDLVSFFAMKGAKTEIKNHEGDTPLLLAVKNGKINSAKALADAGASIFEKDAEGKTPLEIGIESNRAFYDALITTKSGDTKDANGQNIVHYFVLKKDEHAIDVCVEKKLPLSIKDNNKETPLDLCYKDCDDLSNVKMAAKLIQGGAEPCGGEYAFFEDAMKVHNPSLRFLDGQTPLHIAAIQGQKGLAKFLIDAGASFDAQDTAGATPLHEAVRYGKEDVAKLLLENGADVNAKDSMGKTPILLVIPRESSLAIYSLLLEYKADCTQKDMFGDSVFHIATLSNCQESVLPSLLLAGADINERNKIGITPLATAVEAKQKEHIAFYAKNNADIHAKDMKGNTPLKLSLEAGNLGVLESLVFEGNVATKDSGGNTPLHIAIQNDANIECIKYILSLNIDVNIRNKDGDTALYLAVRKNRKAVGDLLLARNADIFATNTQGYSPIKLALQTGGSVQEWMLSSGTIVATDSTGNTVLHKACEWNIPLAVNAIITKGGNVEARNANGQTPLFKAAQGGNSDIIKALYYANAKMSSVDYFGNTPTHIAVQWNRLDALCELICLRAPIDLPNTQGLSPLAYSVKTGKMQSADILIRAGANINSCDITGKSILSQSVEAGKVDVASYLLNNGANVQQQDMYGRTCYHIAVENGNIAMVDLLRKSGASPLSRDLYGNTPFYLAAEKGNQALLESTLGVDTTIIDSDGNTPIHICVQEGCSKQILDYLIKKGYPIDSRNSTGKSALSLALQNDFDELAAELIQAKANPFIYDNSNTSPVEVAITRQKNDILCDIVRTSPKKTDILGNTYLHIAAKCATQEQITTLIQMGQNKDTLNTDGQKPCDVAVLWQRPDIASLLK